ncbi:hypothetical protein SPAN111604_08295 [Sphingomonas antarctica]
MFAVVRTGGKQYRVAAGDKIVIDKIDGEAGARVSLGDILFTGGGDAVSSVAAEIIAQAKGEKVIVFKKKRRHNYRRKAGHRQQHTILKILSVGDTHAEEKPKAAKAEKPVVEAPVEAAPAVETAPVAAEAPKAVKAKAPAKPKAAPAAAASDDAVAAAPVKKAAVKKAPAAKPAADKE